MEHGIIIKAYPTRGYAHRLIDAAIDFRTKLAAETRDVCALDISVPDYYLELLVYNAPQTSAQAMFSAPYNVAAALIYEPNDPDTVSVTRKDEREAAVLRVT